MFGGMKRRGLRLIVSRGERIGDLVTLMLECGHSVQRHHRNDRSRNSLSAVCSACARADGAKRDAALLAKVPA